MVLLFTCLVGVEKYLFDFNFQVLHAVIVFKIRELVNAILIGSEVTIKEVILPQILNLNSKSQV
jgi:hypothetical protein